MKVEREFTQSVRLTEHIYMQRGHQRIRRMLIEDNGFVICSEDYPAASNKGELAKLVNHINELSRPGLASQFINDTECRKVRQSLVRRWVKKLLAPIVREIIAETNSKDKSASSKAIVRHLQNAFSFLLDKIQGPRRQ